MDFEVLLLPLQIHYYEQLELALHKGILQIIKNN